MVYIFFLFNGTLTRVNRDLTILIRLILNSVKEKKLNKFVKLI